MATSGTIQAAIRTGYRIQIAWTVDSQSVANNTSTVTAKVQLVSTGSSYTINSSASKSGSLTINGTKYSFTFSAALSGNQTKNIYTKTVTISHGSDGSKTCSFACSVGINVTLSGTYYGTITASGSGVFDTIPRASTISSVTSSVAVNGTNAVTVAISRKASSFTHTVVFKFGSYSKTTTGVGTSTSYAIPTSWLNAIPNATSGTATVTVTTYSGSTKVGSAVSKNFTLTVPSTVVPTISSVAVADTTTNQTTFGNMVQNKSKAKFTITAAGASGSTISAYKTVFQGKTYTGATPTTSVITGSGTVTATITVTDSRGRTASTTKSWTVVAYTAPKINTFTAIRANGLGAADDNGTMALASIKFSIAAVNDKNSASYLVEYRQSGTDTWTEAASGSVYSYDSDMLLNVNFSPDASYDLRLTLTDSFVTVTAFADVATAFTLIDFNASGKGIAFGKVSELTEGMEFALPLYSSHNGKVLWSGAWYMTAGHTATLSEKVSEQLNGIVIVFSRIGDSVAQNDNFACFFVPKYVVAQHPNLGMNFFIAHSSFEYCGAKYLYIGDTQIKGHANNSLTGTGAVGITYENNRFIMRYVIGV